MRLVRAVVLFVAVAALSGLLFLRFNQAYSPSYGKGGVGIVRPDVYVVTKGPVNQVLWGTSKWMGSSHAQAETVLFDGSAVESVSCSRLLHRPLVIRFTPERIQAYDLRALSGGYYMRAPQ